MAAFGLSILQTTLITACSTVLFIFCHPVAGSFTLVLAAFSLTTMTSNKGDK